MNVTNQKTDIFHILVNFTKLMYSFGKKCIPLSYPLATHG